MVFTNWTLVLVLLASLTISYQQVIHAYPKGGGAYMVSTENLSPSMGLIAGGSLLVDYMLTVAVSVSSGSDAITSAFPAIKEFNLEISIVLVLALMFMNLRGLRESAKSLMIPVYLFIVSILFLIAYGAFQILTGHLAYTATAHIGKVVPGVSIILLLRAFTSGSASLTGVEAISNAVPFFKKPKKKCSWHPCHHVTNSWNYVCRNYIPKLLVGNYTISSCNHFGSNCATYLW